LPFWREIWLERVDEAPSQIATETVAQKLIELYRQVISRRDTQAVRPR
jgi:hypothetical protein